MSTLFSLSIVIQHFDLICLYSFRLNEMSYDLKVDFFSLAFNCLFMRIHSFFVYPLLDFFEIYGRLASIKANARASYNFTKKIRILTKRINSLHRDRGKKMTCLKRITNKCRFFVSFIFLGRVK